MGRKKSGKYAADQFKGTTASLRAYVQEIGKAALSAQTTDRAYDAALVKTAVAFEKLMLESLIVAVNNDTAPFSQSAGIRFPKHMTQGHCEYLITAGGYFDYQGRNGLLKDVQRFTGGKGHWLYDAVKADKYFHHLELLIALRNFAAHESPQAKKKMKRAIFCQRHRVKSPEANSQLEAQFVNAYAPASAGAWAKKQNRFTWLLDGLDSLATDIYQGAPR